MRSLQGVSETVVADGPTLDLGASCSFELETAAWTSIVALGGWGSDGQRREDEIDDG